MQSIPVFQERQTGQSPFPTVMKTDSSTLAFRDLTFNLLHCQPKHFTSVLHSFSLALVLTCHMAGRDGVRNLGGMSEPQQDPGNDCIRHGKWNGQ